MHPELRSGAAIFTGALLILLILLVRLHMKMHPPVESSPLPVIFEIEGDVRNPGVHILESSRATFAEAVMAGGGFQNGPIKQIPEDLSQRRLTNGERLRVILPSSGEIAFEFGPMQAAARLVLGEKLELNQATEEELALVPLMKPQFASFVVDRRTQRAWQSLDELREIPGVGSETIRRWGDYLQVGHEYGSISRQE